MVAQRLRGVTFFLPSLISFVCERCLKGFIYSLLRQSPYVDKLGRWPCVRGLFHLLFVDLLFLVNDIGIQALQASDGNFSLFISFIFSSGRFQWGFVDSFVHQSPMPNES